MITLAEAWRLLDRHTEGLETTDVPISQCVGWVTAEDIRAPISVASFRSSAMDGFAVATQRFTTLPMKLETNTTLYAGDYPDPACFSSGKAIKVMTGAFVPDVYDAVIPKEEVTYDDHTVTITQPVTSGQHIRLPGEDLVFGELVVAAGTPIQALAIGVLASLGMNTVKVVRKPRVLIVSTGDELVAPGNPLKAGQRYDSGGATLRSMIEPFCCSVTQRPVAADDMETLTRELQFDHDVVITTGGVSVGEKDFVPSAATRAGWRQIFHKVAIKPGKPVFVATQNGRLLFGLPGNPLSTAVICMLFVIPALKKMTGRTDCRPPWTEAELACEPLQSNRPVIWPGKIWSQCGRYIATISAKRSSAALSALLDSDGLIFQSLTEIYQPPRVQVWTWEQILK